MPRYTVMLSEAELRDSLGLLRGGAEFVAALDLETLVRGVAACDFLGAAALPAAGAAVCARLLPGAEAAAKEDAKEALLAVMKRTSFGPALWATAPLETVGRLSVGSAEQQDERGVAVVRMARSELARRTLALPVGLGHYRAWEHPFIVSTIVNFTSNYRAFSTVFCTILHYSIQNSAKIASLANPNFSTCKYCFGQHLESRLSKIQLKSSTKTTK